jgi:prevent-host-death family protein
MLATNLANGASKLEHVVNMHEAKSQLSKLVALAQQGESVTIAIHGRPVAKLLPIKPKPVFGLGRNECPPVPWSAFAPMSDDEAAEWGL